MANYNPPLENLPIFDNSVFLSNETPVTIDYANKHYLKYPNAQGTENLQTINVAGVATFNNNAVVNGVATFNNNAVINANLLIDDTANNTSSIIEQNNTILRIGSCANTQTPNSNISLYATDGTGNVVQQVSITNALTQIINPASFNSTTPPVSSQTIPASNDSSNKIPTTAWVQNAISASVTTQFVPKFVNYTDTQGGTSGYSNGPYIYFNNTWAPNDIAYFRITSQISYNPNGSGEYQNTGETMGIIFFRPYYMTNNWAPVSSSGGTLQKYCSNTGGAANRNPYYYLPAFNIGNTGNFYLNGGTVGRVRVSTLNPGSPYEFFVSIEYIGARVSSGGTVTFGNGSDSAGINNSLP